MKTNLRKYANHCIDSGHDEHGAGAAYEFKSPIDGQILRVIISNGLGWDHVSISHQKRCPNWVEMEWVIRKFAKEDEYWMQLHVPESEHINCHPYCLHWWRPQNEKIPIPPSIMVGIKT